MQESCATVLKESSATQMTLRGHGRGKVVLTPISQVGAQVNPCFSREYSTLMICLKKYARVKIRVSVKERHVDLD